MLTGLDIGRCRAERRAGQGRPISTTLLTSGADPDLWFTGLGHNDEIDLFVAKALFDRLGLLGQETGHLFPVRGTHLTALMGLDKLLVKVVHRVGFAVVVGLSW